ncbi:peptidase M48 Ste24p [Candidatus Marinamargulisbacteria bacterium SCGC AG-439-L15]|nr:peptidase M48 Ste24p [Candidatus Marinamargulisbacteria bacterium SCGC AG-439-L15]
MKPIIVTLLGITLVSLTPVFGETPPETTNNHHFHDRISSIMKKTNETNISAEIEFGRNLAARLLGKYKLSKNTKLNKYVSLIGTGIAAQMGRPELNYYFGVIESNEMNAYACPGGYIFITTGAIKKMTNEAQLAGVLAHEISHVNRKHVIKKIKFSSVSSSTISEFSSIVGASSQTARLAMNQLLDQAMKVLLEKGLEKKEELESDTDGIQMLIALNYDWKPYASYLTILGKTHGHNSKAVISKTHPTPTIRIAHIKNELKSLGYIKNGGRRHESRFASYVKI